ncbi:endonuclease/exonuclease/phosphatase family protein [uncultured Ferrimonas sp.]|uniref:endonuclease/exonuclease/phosphatase family protein n=1 Tax=uncultured Ferrimonas sp. TaxID=432640 RepID=UPI002637822D|nr:endonuclease/exonuclease/phosphatase family protein [uncultured Ferrimonas sp.]
MRFTKTLLAAAIATTVLAGCNDDTTNNTIVQPEPAPATDVRIASYNLSFDHSNFEELVEVMGLTAAEQDALVAGWADGSITDDAELKKAEKVIQIRNTATVIQKERPAVLLMKEFNNDGTGEDQTALNGFRSNYLAVPQQFEGAALEPILFDFARSYATNTGLNSGLDLDNDNDGSTTNPGDSYGFGFFHGQYAFALLSQYPIDDTNTRTFQKFLWKDMPNAINPAVNCNEGNDATWCNDATWFSAEEWDAVRLSSKNHVDVPVMLPNGNNVHLLLSHPTPPIFDKGEEAPYNKDHNAAEIQFWNDYIDGESYIVDDAGVSGGLPNGDSFIVMGDLNADPIKGDGHRDVIAALMNDDQVNTMATTGVYAPKSYGAQECVVQGATTECREDNADTEFPARATSTSGLRLDHVIPSQDLNVVDSGVFWPASFEDGRILMNDDRLTLIDKWNPGVGKNVSSDHRMVWIELEL